MAADLDTEFQHVTGRDVAALQDARPACIIGARTNEGEVCFATVIWVTPVSHEPAMVAFALRAKSRTMQIIRETGVFSLCIPAADEAGMKLVEFCGTHTGNAMDKGACVPHTLEPVHLDPAVPAGAGDSPVVPVPMHAYSWETGTVDSIREAGDHLLAVGTITCAATCAERDGRGQLVPYGSLLCVQHGCYGRVCPL